MSLVDDMLPILDAARGLVASFGLNKYTVTVRQISWSLDMGTGVKTVVDTPIYVNGNQNPQVVEKSGGADLIASGGVYSSDTYEIGPITPPFAGGGVSAATLDPAQSSTPTEVYYLLTGPGLPAGGALFRKIGERFDSPFRYMITVKKAGEEP